MIYKNSAENAADSLNQDYLVGDYCRVVQKKTAKDVLLAFSAVGVPKGKFNGTRALSQSPFNIIYFNCPKTWYINGIPGLGETIEDTVERIRSLIHAIPTYDPQRSRLFSYGGSMGGYGAIMYGCLLNAEAVIATGAEFKLMIPGGATIRALKNRVSSTVVQNANLANVVSQAKTRVHLYYGENNYSDLVCGLEVADCNNVTLGTLRNFNHSLPPYISYQYGLAPFISHHMHSATSFRFHPDAEGDLFECPDLIRSLQAVVQQNEQVLAGESGEAIIKALKSVFLNQSLSANIRSHAAFGLSVYHQKCGRQKAAISFCQKATVLNSNNLRFWMRLSKLLLEENRYSGALKAANQAIALDQPGLNLNGFDAYCVKVKSLLLSGHRQQALEAIASFKAQHDKETKSDIRRRNRISIFEETIDLYALELFDWSAVSAKLVLRRKPVNGHFSLSKFDSIDIHTHQHQASLSVGGLLLGNKPGNAIVSITARQGGADVSTAKTGISSPVAGRQYDDIEGSDSCRFLLEIKDIRKGVPIKVVAHLKNRKSFEIGKVVFNLKPSYSWLSSDSSKALEERLPLEETPRKEDLAYSRTV